MRRLHQIHVAIFLRECAVEQITPIQWGILTIVQAKPGVGHIEIAEELGLDRSNVANVVNRLAYRGLLKKTTSKRDRRKRSVSITPQGRKLKKAFTPKAQSAQRRLLAVLNEKERGIFMHLLARLVEDNNELSRAPIRLEE